MGTRAKAKKAKDAGEARQDLLRKVAASKELSFLEKAKLYHWDRPVCQGDRTNLKDSPNCLCALIPLPNGVRKHGLWCKTPEAVTVLGDDPGYRKRVSWTNPIGLTNLGATCYVNSILQCLYMNADFRKGLFQVEERLLEGNPVLKQLCRLFVKLQRSNEDPVDPESFAKTLQLDNGVQQDGQEFMKLLLTLLEKLLGQSKSPDVRDLVQGLFRGTFSYVTRCSACGNESASSKNLVDFYELEVNVKGFDGLADSLDDYLGEELLEGDNQYMCEQCNRRVDATRSVKLRSLPPLLNFQLKRFVFNPKTATKKKVTSRFSFPITVDLQSRLTPGTDSASPSNPEASAAASQDGLYDLAAILVHKGALATSGHYIAHIRDERTGDWWQFDDETVTSLGAHPLGEAAAATAAAKGAKENGQMDEDGKEKESLAGSEGLERSKPSDAEGVGPSDGGGKPDPELLTSADSYMLMYRRRDARQVAAIRQREERQRRKLEAEGKEEVPVDGNGNGNGNEKDRNGKESKRKSEGEVRIEKAPKRARTGKGVAKDASESGPSSRSVVGTSAEAPITVVDSPAKGGRNNGHLNGGGRECDDNGQISGEEGAMLDDAPESLLREVEHDNDVFEASIEGYKTERERIEKEVNLRRQEVRDILLGAAAAPVEYDFRWVSTEWLRSWADNKDPPGPIDNTPLLCEHEKVPPRNVPLMKRINKDTWLELSRRYNGGPELSADDCCEECVRKDADAAQSADSFRTRRTAMREQLENELAFGIPGTHYVSKQWLNTWQRKRVVDAPSETDMSPTAALWCPHERLKPDCAPGAKRQVVSGDFWAYIQEVAEDVAGPDHRGHAEILATIPECTECKESLGEEMNNRQGLKSGKLTEKAALDALYTGRLLPLSGGVNTFLVPTKWLDSWRDYVGATGRTMEVIAEPPPLAEAFTPALCKHGSLRVCPPELTWRKSDVIQAQKDCFFTVVSENDWARLKERWHSDVEISAAVTSPQPENPSPAKADVSMDVVIIDEKGAAPSVSDPRPVPDLKTIPEVCDACYKERLDEELAERLSYKQQEIVVELVPGSEPPSYLTGAAGEGERKSRRVRKVSATGSGRMTVKVNADMTVKDLKMMIWERMGVDEVNQRLGFLKQDLDDENSILADYGIIANSRLWLINTGEFHDRDIAECFGTGEEAGEMENGFKGTGLLWAGAASDYSGGDADQTLEDTDMNDADGREPSDSRGSGAGAVDDVAGHVCEEAGGDGWSCKKCTLDNSPGRKACGACQSDRDEGIKVA